MLLLVTFLFLAATPAYSAVAKSTQSSCSLSDYSCSNGDCVSADAFCDGKPDCSDQSDEVNCQINRLSELYSETVINRSKRQSGCRKNQWKCRDGSCISFDGKCDGIVDCADGSDETHALCRKNKCQSNWFRCTYGACVDGTAPCNGLPECADSSDELLPRCRNETTEVRGQFKCLDGNTIPASGHCDGLKDCPDGSDETVRACAGKSCPSYLFQCAYGACVDSGADCNKVVECADGSDEAEELCGTAPVTIKPTTGNCVLPPFPEHGSYTTNVAGARPGLGYKYVTLEVTCQRGYGAQGSAAVSCQDGVWREQLPKCVRQCRLDPHPSVEYKCLVTGQVTGTRACNTYEPVGTTVAPSCRRPNYYSPTTLTFMRCIDGYWDYTARCWPGLTKTGTNITILIKDVVEIFKSQFNYTVPYDSQRNDKSLGSGWSKQNSQSKQQTYEVKSESNNQSIEEWLSQNQFNLSESYLDSLFNTSQTSDQWISKFNLSDPYLNWVFNRTGADLYNNQYVPKTDSQVNINTNSDITNDDDNVNIDVRSDGGTVKNKQSTINIYNSSVFINTVGKKGYRG